MESGAIQQLAGTEDVVGVVWSRDSKKLAFVSEGKLKKIGAGGGAAQILAEVGQIRGGDWSSDNLLVSISESGGTVKPITKLDAERKDTIHAVPAFLPDGKHFVFVVVAGKAEEMGIYLGALDSQDPPKRVLQLNPNRFNGMADVSGYR